MIRIDLLLPACAAGLLLASPAAAADPSEAEVLFRQGKQWLAEGKLAEACEALGKSQFIDPGAGTLFHLAECYERSGRTASAWWAYQSVEEQTRAANQPERARVAGARARALEPRLSYVIVRVSPQARASTSGLRIERDGAALEPDRWGAPVPVDPGEHVVVAMAPGKAPYRMAFAVAGDAERVSVDVPVLLDAPGVAGPPRPEAATPSPSPHPAETIAVVSLAVAGVAGLGVGTYFGLRSMSEHADARAQCDGNVCQPGGYALRIDAIHDGDASTFAFAAGGTALAAAAVVWLVALRRPSSSGPRVGLAAHEATVGWGAAW
jgi:serine/threonine-protein kinase